MASVTNWVIGREPIRTEGELALVPVRLPWYRSLPLSSLEELSVSVAGREVAPDALRLRLGEAEYSLAELAERSEEYWFVQDTGWVPVSAGGLGDEAAVAVTAAFRIPYLMIGPGKALTRVVADEVVLPVEGGDR